MKKVLLSLLFVYVCALSGTALAGNPHGVVCEAPIVTCEAPIVDMTAVVAELEVLRVIVASIPTACPAVTVPACPEPTPAVCPAPSIEGVYQFCKLRTDGSRKCGRRSFYKLFKNDGGYEQGQK